MQSPLLPFDASGLDAQCEELDSWQRTLGWKSSLRSWSGRLRRDAETEAVAASTRMEGVPVTVEEVRHILAGARPTDVEEGDAALVEGYRDAIRFAQARSDAPGFEWNAELIVGLHDRAMAGRADAGAGRFATGSRWVANQDGAVFEPPQPTDIVPLVGDACKFLNSGQLHPAIAAAWVHVATAAIHPFRDGNGRTARVLASLAMYHGGFRLWAFTTLESWWGRHPQDYYDAFTCLGRRFRRDADVTPFIAAHVSAQLAQVRSLDLREKVESRIWEAITEAVAQRGLDERVVNAAWEAFFEREITAGYYRSVADVSPATATHDLRALVASGLLAARGERRGRRYVPGPTLYGAVARQLGLFVGDAEVDRTAIVAELSSHFAGGGGTNVERSVVIRALHLLRDSALDYEITVRDSGDPPWTVRASLSPEVWISLGATLDLAPWGVPQPGDVLSGAAEQIALTFVDVIVDSAAAMSPRPQEIKVGPSDTTLLARIERRGRERLAASGL